MVVLTGRNQNEVLCVLFGGSYDGLSVFSVNVRTLLWLWLYYVVISSFAFPLGYFDKWCLICETCSIIFCKIYVCVATYDVELVSTEKKETL